jgi:Tat protein translocase TatB subunit
MFLLILDSLSSSELLVILGAALIFFGPRRLPQLSRQLGKALTEFRRASEDFKRTWEREVNLEDLEKGVEPSEGNSILDKATERLRAAREAAARDTVSDPAGVEPAAPGSLTPAITAIDPSLVQPHTEIAAPAEPPRAVAGLSKHDWL